MSPQVACLRGWLVTLVAFVWLFPTVCIQMPPQIACLRTGIVTLVAFVWLFSTVRFQMCPQIACLRRRKVTRLAFIWLLSTVYFQMCSQNVCSERCIITLGAFISWKSFISQDSVYQRHNISFCHHSPCCKGVVCPKFDFKQSKTAKWIREFGGRFIRAHSNHSPMMT